MFISTNYRGWIKEVALDILGSFMFNDLFSHCWHCIRSETVCTEDIFPALQLLQILSITTSTLVLLGWRKLARFSTSRVQEQ